MTAAAAALLALAAALLGAIIGSFIATLCLRWPRGEGASTGRSRCDSCGVTLRAIDLVPIASAVALRGRCRRCGGRVDPFHLRVELAAAAIGAVALLAAPGLSGAVLAVFGWLLLPLLLLDWRHFWLPDRLTLLLAAAGVALGGLLGLASLAERLIGSVAGFAALTVIAVLYRQVRGRQGLGQGDPKLFGAIGLWLGWAHLPQALLVGALLGLLLVFVRRRGMPANGALPFGAPLAAGAWVVASTALVG